MTYPEQLVPHRLFDQHLSTSTGFASVQNLTDLHRELSIRYPLLKPNIYQTEVCEEEKVQRERFSTMWSQWGEHTYQHNSLGFRDKEPLLDVGTCYYGCSQTYAQGVPVAGRYGQQLDKIMGDTSNNFAMCGTGIDDTLQLFMATSNFIRMKRAVFNFPDISRFTAPFMDDNNKGDVRYYSLMFTQQYRSIPLYKNHRNTIDKVYDTHHRLPLECLNDRMRNTVQMIAYIGALKGIDIIMTSWTQHAYEALMVFNKYPNTTWRLAPWVSPKIDIGRDGMHFGAYTHKAIAESLAQVV